MREIDRRRLANPQFRARKSAAAKARYLAKAADPAFLEQQAMRVRERRRDNPELRRKETDTHREYVQRRMVEDPTFAAAVRIYRENNRPNSAAREAARRAQKLLATPRWASRNAIACIYRECAQLTKNSGIDYQVDHILPLRSKMVCGLHVENNLRVITAKDNATKLNRWST